MNWSKPAIRAARKAPLAPLLQGRGLALQPLADGNYRVVEREGLLVKEGFWRWPDRGIEGNAIDYFMRVEGLSFNDAMQVITAGEPA